MIKNFKYYSIGWLATLSLFNICTFLTPNEINGISKFNALFWISYSLITLFFIVQLVCTYFVFNEKNNKKKVFNLPLFIVSYISLIIMLVIGGLCMSIIVIPTWIGIILCSIVTAISVIAFVSAKMFSDSITNVNEEVAQKTSFIRMLTGKSQSLLNSINEEDNEFYTITKDIFEKVKYSNLKSDKQQEEIEIQILELFNEYSNSVNNNDLGNAKRIYKKLIGLLEERNISCRLSK